MPIGTLSRVRLNSSPRASGSVNFSFPTLPPSPSKISGSINFSVPNLPPSPSKISPNVAFKATGQIVISHVGSSTISPHGNQGLRSRAISEASSGMGMRSRTTSDAASFLPGQPALSRHGTSHIGVTSPRSGGNPELRCRTISESSGVSGLRCRTTSEVTNLSSPMMSPKTVFVGARSRATTSTPLATAETLPKTEVNWLMGTLRSEDLATFDSRFFVNDCRRRFQELDKDKTGLLSIDNLQSAIVEMYPTLQLELVADGHRIPAMHKSIPNLIATFDTDGDGQLNFDDFVTFVKFQRAWRDKFFLNGSMGGMTKSDAFKAVNKQSSVSHSERMGSRDPVAHLDRVQSASWVRNSAGLEKRKTTIVGTAVLQPSAKRFSKTFTSRHGVLDDSRGAFYCSYNNALDELMKMSS